MQEIKNYLKQYFDKNKKELCDIYPGLSSDRLISEYCLYYKRLPNEIYIERGNIFFDHVENGVPLEYIQSNAFFYRSNFYVDENVLIPRSETEILVEDCTQFIKNNYHSDYSFAEVGTGSLAISLSIAMEIDNHLSIWGGDLSPAALEISKVNLFKLRSKINKNTQISLVLSDRLNETKDQYDLIVSNPPYIKEKADREGVHVQADKFEPHIALFLEDSIFNKWFEDFFSDAFTKLKPKGAFFMEGHEDSLVQLQEIALKYFPKVSLKNDYTGRLRFLHAYK